MTPFMRAAMRSTIAGLEGFLDLTSIAVLETTVSIALRPAAFMVSPDSGLVSLWIGHCLVESIYRLNLRLRLRLLRRRLLLRCRSIL